MQFIDLKRQYSAYKNEIDQRMQAVLDHGQYILGPEVRELEETLGAYVGVQEAVGVASGTDALQIALMALDVRAGDEIITTPFSFIATVEVILALGAKPVFIDLDPVTYAMRADLLEAAITDKTRAILPVSLYGLMPDLAAIQKVADKRQIPVIEDAAQSFGASSPLGRSCGVTKMGCTSFFPAKPFGCYGDGGMIFTDDSDLAAVLKQIRVHGQAQRYRHNRLGVNGRLDTLQAAVLLAKWPYFTQEVEARAKAGRAYSERMQSMDQVTLPTIPEGYSHVFGQFTVRVPERESVVASMKEQGIPVAVHYPVPLHQQPVLKDYGCGNTSFPAAEQAAGEVLSLPMHPFITEADQDGVVSALKKALS